MKLKKIERMICENKMTPAQVYTKMLEHVDSLEKDSKHLSRICNMILNIDVVICPEEIREDGMAILKETEFNKLFDYVHRDVCGIL